MDILLQQGRVEYKPLLDLTEARHHAYAMRHRLEYWRFDGPFIGTPWTGHWDAICLMRWALTIKELDRLYWLDADTLIVGDEPLSAAFPEDPQQQIGMVRHPGPPEHWNCGVLMLRASELTRAWLDEVWRRGPGVYPWYQQQIMNELLDTPEWWSMAFRLDDRWNSTFGVNESPEPQIVAWHSGRGPGEKVELMRMYMKDLTGSKQTCQVGRDECSR